MLQRAVAFLFLLLLCDLSLAGEVTFQQAAGQRLSGQFRQTMARLDKARDQRERQAILNQLALQAFAQALQFFRR